MTVLLAEANSQSENTRGQGDAERNRIFADAYGKDADFFSFYRTMQAYERSIQHGDTHLVLRPDTDFFRFFGDPSGTPPEHAAAPGAPLGAASASPTPFLPEALSPCKYRIEVGEYQSRNFSQNLRRTIPARAVSNFGPQPLPNCLFRKHA
jgi:hypothetical protein